MSPKAVGGADQTCGGTETCMARELRLGRYRLCIGTFALIAHTRSARAFPSSRVRRWVLEESRMMDDLDGIKLVLHVQLYLRRAE